MDCLWWIKDYNIGWSVEFISQYHKDQVVTLADWDYSTIGNCSHSSFPKQFRQTEPSNICDFHQHLFAKLRLPSQLRFVHVTLAISVHVYSKVAELRVMGQLLQV